jgi:hypothetical protein
LDVGLLKRRRPWLGWRTSKPTSHAVPDSRESGARRARDFTSWIPLQRSSFMGQKRCSTSTPSLARGSPDRVSRAPSMTRSARGVRRSRDETCDGSVLVDLDDDDVGAGPRAMSIGSSTGCLTGVSGRLATGSRVAVGLQRSPCGLDIGTSADTGCAGSGACRPISGKCSACKFKVIFSRGEIDPPWSRFGGVKGHRFGQAASSGATVSERFCAPRLSSLAKVPGDLGGAAFPGLTPLEAPGRGVEGSAATWATEMVCAGARAAMAVCATIGARGSGWGSGVAGALQRAVGSSACTSACAPRNAAPPSTTNMVSDNSTTVAEAGVPARWVRVLA